MTPVRKSVSIASDPINWVKAGPISIIAKLTGNSNGAEQVNAPSSAHGAVVKLYKLVNGHRKLVKSSTLNGSGDKSFKVADKNGKRYTKYVAVVSKTARTKGDTTNSKTVR